MHVVKDKFILLKGVPNVLRLSATKINRSTITEATPRRVFAILKINVEQRVDHFTKDRIFKLMSNIKARRKVKFVNLPDYNLVVSYNKSTRDQIINLRATGTTDISRIDPRNLYAMIAYAICFSDLVTGKHKVSAAYSVPITDFFVSLYIRLFGKEYGLIGMYATEIPKLKFLVSCYIQGSFFGISNGTKMYKQAGAIATYKYDDIKDQLGNYDLANIEDFIKALSDLKVMPGINKYSFTSRILKLLTIHFLPAIEDCSRFLSIVTAASLTGTSVVPTFIAKAYNAEAFGKILEIPKVIFRRA